MVIASESNGHVTSDLFCDMNRCFDYGGYEMRTRRNTRTEMGTRRLTSVLVLIAFLGGHAWCATAPSGGAEEQVRTQAISYIASLTGDKVFIRSGAGTHFYDCGRLNRGDTVEVWGTEQGWSKITPPALSFSWVATKHIVVDPADPTVGVVTGLEAIVYAGSDFEKPMHSTTIQVTLKRGDKTHLLNEEMDGYLKISPPPNSYLWVSSQFLQRVETPQTEAPTVLPPVSVDVAPSAVGSEEPIVTEASSAEASLLAEYYAIKMRVEEELAKPREEQNYDEIEALLNKLAGNEESEKVAKYAQIFLSRIAGYKLAIKVGREVAVQDELLKEATLRINRARLQRLAQAPKLGRFAVIGMLKKSNVNLRRYRIVAASGKTLCYAQPVGSIADDELTQYLDKKVGLIGSVKAHAPSKSALVEFTKIEGVR